MTDVEEAVHTLKKLIRNLANDSEFSELQARYVRKLYNAYINEGFTLEQATQFICASLKTSKQ